MGLKLKIKKDASAQDAKPAAKGKPFRATRGPKFILFIGDEGAILLYVKGSVVQSRQFVPDAGPQHLEEFRQTIAQDNLAPILMVVDTMDQSYLQQTLPPVSSLSTGKLIKRRLERDFGPNDIKGAILLGREKSGRKDWNFLMVSLEKSPQLVAWLEFVSEFPNRFRGIRLVSVETEILLKNLERAIGVSKESSQSRWKFFVSHNKVGGFRQVILRDGRIIFTRLAQPVGEATTEVIAGNIEQEMLSTIEYMKRLAFNPQDGLDIYIVASSGIKETLDRSKFNYTSLTLLTPFEVAEHLGIKGATQPSDQFGDVILAASIGSNRKHILTLSTPESKTLDTYFQLIYYQRLFAILAVFGLVCYAAMLGYDIYKASLEREELSAKKTRSQETFSLLQEEVARSNFDVESANDLITLYQQLMEEKATPLPLIEQLRVLVQPPIRIKEVSWSIPEPEQTEAADLRRSRRPPRPTTGAPAASFTKPMTVNIKLEFPEEANEIRLFKLLSTKVLNDFKNAFPPPYEVEYAALPAALLGMEKTEIEFGDEMNGTPPAADFGPMPEVELIIKGEMLEPRMPEVKALIESP